MSEGTQGPAGPRLALVDDDVMTRRALKSLFEDEGWVVDAFETGEEALGSLGQGVHDALVTDNVLPGIRGVELVRTVRAARGELPCVIISGYDPQDDLGVPWFRKPIDFDALAETLRSLVFGAGSTLTALGAALPRG